MFSPQAPTQPYPEPPAHTLERTLSAVLHRREIMLLKDDGSMR